jgi:hypothetical protein
MNKGILIVLTVIFLFPFTSEAELSKEAINAVGRFLKIDFITAKNSENRKPLTNVFYVKETGQNGNITREEIELVVESKGLLPAGEYKTIIIINEISGIGLIERTASINKNNQIIWNDSTKSLMEFMFTPHMGNVSLGVTPLLEYKDANKIADLFKGCQVGEIPNNWKPSEEELNFYYKTIDFFYILSRRLP